LNNSYADIQPHKTRQDERRLFFIANEEAKTNKEIAKHLGINLCDVTRWTKRWIDRAMESVEARLSDSPRSGAPDRITAEQWCQIMALACEPPEEHGLPITHWTHKELAKEAVKQGIVEAISPSHAAASEFGYRSLTF
jgi:putative transposase